MGEQAGGWVGAHLRLLLERCETMRCSLDTILVGAVWRCAAYRTPNPHTYA